MDSPRKQLTALTITVITLGLFCSYMIQSSLPEGVWEKYYYVWDKGKDLLLVLTLAFYSGKTYKKYLLSLSVFLLIRLLWEGLAIQNWKFANRWEILDILFLMDLVLTIFILLSDLTKNQWGQKL